MDQSCQRVRENTSNRIRAVRDGDESVVLTRVIRHLFPPPFGLVPSFPGLSIPLHLSVPAHQTTLGGGFEPGRMPFEAAH